MSVIGYCGNIPPKLLPWRGLKLTSCCQEGIHWMLSVICRTLLFHLFECYHKLSVELCDCIPHPQLGSVCLGSGHKININWRWHRKHKLTKMRCTHMFLTIFNRCTIEQMHVCSSVCVTLSSHPILSWCNLPSASNSIPLLQEIALSIQLKQKWPLLRIILLAHFYNNA